MQGLQLGSLMLDGTVVLAPLAGVTHLPFRQLCREYGASLVSSEMVSCHGVVRRQPNTWRMLVTDPGEKPVAFQLFGADPGVMAEASVKLAEVGADVVDLNFGCPVPKVVRHGGGSALLKEPQRLQEIVAACVRACPCPVTVKIRAGWDEDQVNAEEIARRVEDAGAVALTVHARTRSQKFEGKADWRVIANVVRLVRIPVIGNGDVWTGWDAQRMVAETGCRGVMVGRGAMGRPWVFQHIRHFLQCGEILPEPALAERVSLIRRHFAGLKALKGERTARLEMRKHTAWYIRGLPNASDIRRRINVCENEEQFLAVLDAVS